MPYIGNRLGADICHCMDTAPSHATTNVCSIYVITNTCDGKVYIGQTWKYIKRRLQGHKNPSAKHCNKLYNALNKYGRDSFTIDCIAVCSNQQNADYLESYYIEVYDSIVNGYNIHNGGHTGNRVGLTHTEETKKVIREKRAKQVMTAESNQKRSETAKANPNLGAFKVGGASPIKGRKMVVDATGKKTFPKLS